MDMAVPFFFQGSQDEFMAGNDYIGLNSMYFNVDKGNINIYTNILLLIIMIMMSSIFIVSELA